ncbi:MAG: tripartite tricarboxylate transporter substrate binding protein [Betaproteobacteria bacterium]|nr:MAG: tripartite tricarboxylate transporter substrate binding protein [Betaproteobacteria bacterium]
MVTAPGVTELMRSLVVFAFLAFPAVQSSAADAYPTRPIRLIVPSGAGGVTDILARILAERMRGSLGQQVVVDNRPGAGGIVGSDIVAKAAPDGYTLLMVFPSHAVNPSLNAKMPYDTVADFAPITLVSRVSQVLLVHPNMPVKSVRELIAHAKARPKELNFGSVGKGSLGHLSGELFASRAGLELVHVAYKGAPQIMAALLSGEVQVYFNVPISALSQIRAGKVRALGVSTRERLGALPEVPTIAESGLPGYESIGWNGILAPARTPRPAIDRMHREVVAALRAPDIQAQLAAQAIDSVGNSPEEFAKIIGADVAKWADVLKRAGIRPD